MQIQMEVCGIDTCEYVEAKFKENVEGPEVEGYISLFIHTEDENDEMKYVYHNGPDHGHNASEPWICIETYSWACTSLRRTIVQRDAAWFTKIRTDIDLFWKEVIEVREGRRILEPAKKRRTEPESEMGYSFVDD